MLEMQKQKLVSVLPPAVIADNTSPTTNVIDTLGFETLTVVVYYGAMDIASTALKIQEDDSTSSATALTSGADVTGLIYGTSTNSAGSTSALPTATDDNTFFVFHVNLKGRKRYLKPVITVGDGAAGTYVTIIGILGRGKQIPATASGRGANQELII